VEQKSVDSSIPSLTLRRQEKEARELEQMLRTTSGYREKSPPYSNEVTPVICFKSRELALPGK